MNNKTKKELEEFVETLEPYRKLVIHRAIDDIVDLIALKYDCNFKEAVAIVEFVRYGLDKGVDKLLSVPMRGIGWGEDSQ